MCIGFHPKEKIVGGVEKGIPGRGNNNEWYQKCMFGEFPALGDMEVTGGVG